MMRKQELNVVCTQLKEAKREVSRLLNSRFCENSEEMTIRITYEDASTAEYLIRAATPSPSVRAESMGTARKQQCSATRNRR